MSNAIKHHPDGATLMAFAAATLPESLAAVVAAHLSMCPTCRREVADLDLVGSVLLDELASPATPGSDHHASAAAWSADDAATVASARRAAASRPGNGLPAPIASVYGLTLDNIPWRWLAPGIWHHRLALRRPGSGDLRLLKVGPGRTLPDHAHAGSELTLILAGSYSDVTGSYHRGDIQDVDESIEHEPVVGAEGDCICLIASEHPARFKSRLPRLLQPLIGL